MKKILILFVWMCTALTSQSQNLPQGIAYQAVAIKEGERAIAGQNPTQLYWANKDIQVRFTIFEKYPGGSNQYSESHATKTDDYGVFNLVIGQGNVISGDFTKIAWDLGTAHLQVEIDFDNNGTYKLTSLERFWSVPYAFVTRKSSSTSTDSALNALNSKFNYLKNRDKDTVIGNEGGVSYKSLDSLNKVLVAKLAAIKTSDKDTIVGNEWQKLIRVGDTLSLSDGGGKVPLLDEDPKNELQVLSRIKDTVLLSTNGGRIVLNDDDPNNELQNLVINGDSITLTSSSKKISLSDLYRSSVSGKQVMAFRNLNDPIKNGLGWKWQMGTSWTTIDTIFAESNFVEYELKLQLKSSQGGAHSFRILDSKGSEVKVLDVNTDAPMWTNFGLDEIYKSNSFSVFDLYSGSSTGGDKECRVTIYIDQCIENEMYLFQMKSSSKSNPCDCLMPIRSRQTSYIH